MLKKKWLDLTGKKSLLLNKHKLLDYTVNVLKIKANKAIAHGISPNPLTLYDERNYWGTYIL